MFNMSTAVMPETYKFAQSLLYYMCTLSEAGVVFSVMKLNTS